MLFVSVVAYCTDIVRVESSNHVESHFFKKRNKINVLKLCQDCEGHVFDYNCFNRFLYSVSPWI